LLELQENIRHSGRNVPMPPLLFLLQDGLAMLPLTVPIWIGGLWFFFFRREGRPFRFLGWAWIATAAVIMTLDPYLISLSPLPSPVRGCGVLWERWLAGPRLRWVKLAYGAAMVLLGALLAPATTPLLRPEMYICYAAAINLQQPRIETHELVVLHLNKGN
jgi:hypothetical protein